MTKRAVIYARYSSDLQSDASIEDQVRLCEALIRDRGWESVRAYSDHGISGASLMRPGYQQLLEDGRAGTFDIVVAESIDRLSRDQEHIAAFHKAMSFAGVAVVTTSEGDINELHIGLKGTMSALYLKDLADKTRRGLEGRVRKGKSGGGICYGYGVLKKLGSDDGEGRGHRYVIEDEAAIICRIFEDYDAGKSPKSIAHALNRECVPGPRGGQWSPSTIYGNWRRGTGILNNELYVGKMIWNRQHFVKDPQTGKRQARLNPEEKWVTQSVPELQIVGTVLWRSVKARQLTTRQSISKEGHRPEIARRPRYLLSGLLECGSCGGGFSKISKTHYGCSTARNKATCSNMLTIRRDELEKEVLNGLKTHLMQPTAYHAFFEEFTREYNARANARERERGNLETKLTKVKADIKKLIDAIKAGVPGDALRDEIQALENQRTEFESRLEETPIATPLLHPNLPAIYQDKITNLIDALNTPDTITQVNEAIRQLIEKVRLVPENKTLNIELFGELAALISLGIGPNDKHPLANAERVQVTLVAGVGFEPTTFRL